MSDQKKTEPASEAGSGVNTKTPKKILRYLKHQLKIREEELKYYETPIQEEDLRDIRKMEEVILKSKTSQLRDLIGAIEYMIDEEEE